jgi:hypothetical protein
MNAETYQRQVIAELAHLLNRSIEYVQGLNVTPLVERAKGIDPDNPKRIAWIIGQYTSINTHLNNRQGKE